MANTLESLKGTSQLVVHNSATDLKDKSPLQAYQGVAVSDVVDAARVPKGEKTLPNGATTLSADSIKNEIVIIPSTLTSGTLAVPAGSGDDNKLIEKLELSSEDATFEFIIINQKATDVVLSDPGDVTYVGASDTTTARTLSANTVAKFIIRADDSTQTAVKIYRVF